MNFYAIYDVKLERYVSPFLAPSDLSAEAMVRDSLDPHSILSQFPKNFDLIRVGSWDEVSGITGTDCKYVCSVASLILQKEGADFDV